MISFVINPVAGKGKAMQIVERIEQAMAIAGKEFEVLISKYPRHTEELARQAVEKGAATIVAVGGDGTVTEVARQMLNSSSVLGIIPRGTGNDLAKSLRVPAEVDEALRVICDGKTMRMDVGDVSGTKFFNVAGCGFDVDVVVRSRKYKKKIGGLGAYLAGVIEAIFSSKLIKMRITSPSYDNERNVLLISIANGAFFGGGMKVAPHAVLDDGLFDVCAISDVPRRKIVTLLPKFINGSHLSLKYCEYFKTDRLSIETATPVTLQVDGEIIELDKLEFSLLKNALEVMIP